MHLIMQQQLQIMGCQISAWEYKEEKFSSIFNLMFDCFSFEQSIKCSESQPFCSHYLSFIWYNPIKLNCPIILFHPSRESIMAPNWLDGNWQVWLEQRYNQKLSGGAMFKRKPSYMNTVCPSIIHFNCVVINHCVPLMCHAKAVFMETHISFSKTILHHMFKCLV